jgi:hypothetical protein
VEGVAVAACSTVADWNLSKRTGKAVASPANIRTIKKIRAMLTPL